MRRGAVGPSQAVRCAPDRADVAELAYALDSKSSGREVMRVQLPPSAPLPPNMPQVAGEGLSDGDPAGAVGAVGAVGAGERLASAEGSSRAVCT
jgi:hypothetical protein